MKVPKLLRRRQGDLAYVYYQRKKIYFGKWNSKEADEAYRAFVMKLASGFVPDADKVCEPTVAEIVLAFFTAKKDYYVKNGKQTRQLGRFKYAVEFPLKLYAQLPAKEFGPRKLVECRDAMLQSGRFSRKYLNVLVTCLRQIFKYAVEYEMIPPDVLTALQAVAPLKKGRTAAREVLPVRPVDASVVDATCAEMSRVVADMVRVQRLTGMRPGEVCSMRVSDVKPAKLDGIWIYELRSDKTDWRRDVGQAKRVVLGPRAYETIRPYLEAKDAEAFVFSPKDAFRDRGKNPRDDVGDAYDSNSYRHAVQRAAERAGVPKWTPNQLRHLYATEIREKYGLEAAQLMLGHSRADVTQIYAERDFKRALEVAAKEG